MRSATTGILTLFVSFQSYDAFTTFSFSNKHDNIICCSSTTSFIRGRSLQVILTDKDDILPQILKDTLIDDEEQIDRILDLKLFQHKPLGCTVEESLAVESDGTSPVFVSKVVEGGNAEKGGIVVGDVILGLTGVFDEIEDVSNAGLERVRALVSGRYPDQPLTMIVMRGTNVMSRHETVLVSLCTAPGGTDTNVDECITSIMQDEDIDFVMSGDANNELGIVCDEEGECMLDAMSAFWGSESDDVYGTKKEKSEVSVEKKKANPRPWASRSSPSGTFVRDPVTGKMQNIG